MRTLCDIDQTAQKIISDFLGGVEFTAMGWNDSSKKSVMLTREGKLIWYRCVYCGEEFYKKAEDMTEIMDTLED
jgi:hypothetical protein